jgi:hypothetical protein
MLRRLPDPLPLLIATSLVGTVSIGVVLRWFLAGFMEVELGFAHLRSAHSHLAWYGVVMPLAWRAWAAAGGRSVTRSWGWLYAAATVVATVAFAVAGYNVVSIAASTVVLAVWVGWALPGLLRVGRREWQAVSGPIVLASAAAIPAVAVLSGRGAPMAAELVQAFLTWLLLGVAMPAALHHQGASPPPAWVTAGLVLLSGAALGPWPSPATLAGLGLTGLGLVVLGARACASVPERASVVLVGAGLLSVAAGALPDAPPIAIAGLHLAALGPVAWRLAWLGPRDTSVAWAYHALLAAFAVSIAAPIWTPHPAWPTAAAAFGSLLAIVWLAVIAADWGARLNPHEDAKEAL